jgi:hypothetical protein
MLPQNPEAGERRGSGEIHPNAAAITALFTKPTPLGYKLREAALPASCLPDMKQRGIVFPYSLQTLIQERIPKTAWRTENDG